MKKILKWLGIVILALPVVAVAWLSYSAEKNGAVPASEALAALTSDRKVIVEDGDWLIMRPADRTASTGVILYPGAYCDIRGYAPVLREIAAAGYFVVGVGMPFEFSIFAPNRATAVREAFPDIQKWVLAGHSMGGAMAGRYADQNQAALAGLLFWDAYPPPGSSLVDNADLPILHIHRSTLSDELPPKYEDNRYLFPDTSEWISIPGGMHMYFGSFDGGSFEETWEAGIARDRQQQIIVAKTLDWLAEL